MYIYIIPLTKSQICDLQQKLMVTRHFFREAFLCASPSTEVVGHTRLIQITSATFGALLVPFHTVTMLPIEAGRRKRKENPPRFVIVLWVNSIVFFCKR